MTEQQEPNKMILNAEEFHTFVPPMYSSALPEQQQEPEYIITEEQVRDIMRFNEHGLKTLQHDTRSCPRKPAPETRREFLTKQNIEQFKEQEREKVLDELTALIDNSKEYGGQDRQELFHYTMLHCMIDSLRNKEQP